ncbi:MAG: TIGR01777 family oxidoreductase, partial [Acidimicrobiia bacterium]|nr:TIGR01777 family oxidoreductase [Acidimicrobiia bacterium]
MRVAITGSSGLIGTALRQSLHSDGHEVLRLVRRPPVASDEVAWDPAQGELASTALAGIDAAVNLAGTGFGDRRWTESYKRSITDSRLDSTGLLARVLAEVGPTVLVSASAVGYYGNAGDDPLTEDSPPADDFAAQVCVRWEAATAPAEEAGVRVAHIRSGLVMSGAGGLLKRLLLPFKWGLGGRIGSGRQYWSW